MLFQGVVRLINVKVLLLNEVLAAVGKVSESFLALGKYSIIHNMFTLKWALFILHI